MLGGLIPPIQFDKEYQFGCVNAPIDIEIRL
ncbi:hypothetical protein J2S24_002481 [Thermoanaerobacter pentosaceus]|uniref:Uncharacterized protein n=1 Tax=Thermoanaerobacter pentosaceus TaxID=694059 RepID=A0ABT9M7A3_9THEO|nr:hypothetical protein [Thermoanaerobacter pentosaceus]